MMQIKHKKRWLMALPLGLTALVIGSVFGTARERPGGEQGRSEQHCSACHLGHGDGRLDAHHHRRDLHRDDAADAHVRMASVRRDRRQLLDDQRCGREDVRAEAGGRRFDASRRGLGHELGRERQRHLGSDGCRHRSRDAPGHGLPGRNGSDPDRAARRRRRTWSLDQQSINPTVITRSTQSIQVHYRVTACGGRPVQGALVYLTAVPFNQFSIAPEAASGADGTVNITETQLVGLPGLEQDAAADDVRPGAQAVRGAHRRRRLVPPADRVPGSAEVARSSSRRGRRTHGPSAPPRSFRPTIFGLAPPWWPGRFGREPRPCR